MHVVYERACIFVFAALFGEGARKVGARHVNDLFAVVVRPVDGVRLIGERLIDGAGSAGRAVGVRRKLILYGCARRIVGVVMDVLGDRNGEGIDAVHRLFERVRVGAQAEDVFSRLQLVPHVPVVVAVVAVIRLHVGDVHFQLQRGIFARLQRDDRFGVRAEVDCRLFDAALLVAGRVIELHDLFACAVARVGDGDFDLDRAVGAQDRAVGDI